MQRHSTVLAGLTAIVLSIVAVHGARAEVHVQGVPDAVVVDARDASVEDVLEALGTSFGLQYRGADALQRRISGTYRGSLQHVVRRVLDGYNFVLKTDDDEIEVVVIGGETSGAGGAGLGATPAAVGQPAAKASTAKERRTQRRRGH
jgi:hypothetical protein